MNARTQNTAADDALDPRLFGFGETSKEVATETEPQTFVTFELSGQCLSVDVTYVREILDFRDVTPLPRAPADITGIIDVRGETVVVVDLCMRLGRSPNGIDENTRFLVLELDHDGSDRLVGIRVDRVLEVAQVCQSELESVPDDHPANDGGHLIGVTRANNRLVLLIDIAGLLSDISRSSASLGNDLFDFDDNQ